jgi:hypothetical protein
MQTSIRHLFPKFSITLFLFGVFSVTLEAQSTKLYYQQGGEFYGTISVFTGPYFEISTNGTMIKTLKKSCSTIKDEGTTGVLCSFRQFVNGQPKYSGQGYFFQNGNVYLKWTSENVKGIWKNIETGWYGFRP